MSKREDALLKAKLELVREAERKHDEKIAAAAAAVGKELHQYLNDIDPKYKSRSRLSRTYAKVLPPEGSPAKDSWR